MTDVVDTVVARLLANREQPQRIAPPSETRTLSTSEAYEVQDRLREALCARGERAVGWKVGLTTGAAQEAFGCDEPVSAFLLGSGVYLSGAEVPFASFAGRAVFGLGLKTGDVVLTGSLTAILRPQPGDTLRAAYTRIGSVSLRLV
jgi:2-keto-4-pentenoate hydratase